ncbi:MAG TPA: NHL repeat-containing protein [Chloroflexota bacterium]|nr:NHL repeat-containing protein [Chloroflexota bacterium]
MAVGFLVLGLAAAALGLAASVLVVRFGPRLLVAEAEAATEQSDERQARSAPAESARPSWFAPAVGVLVVLALAGAATLQRATRAPRAPAASAAPRRMIALPPATLPAATSLTVLAVLGGPAAGPGQLNDPRDVAVDAAGNVYVADTGNHRVVKFSANGRFLAAWSGTAGAALVEPVALAVVPDGLIVADNATGQVHKFAFNGAPVPAFEHADGLFRPRGIAVDATGNTLVADTGNNRLLKLSPDGTPIASFTASGQLDQPTAVAFGPGGALFVAEPDANAIAVLSSSGGLAAQWAMDTNSTVLPPHLLWLASAGLLATLPAQQGLALYNPAGQVSRFWAAPGDLQRPLGIAAAGKAAWVISNGTNELLKIPLPK